MMGFFVNRALRLLAVATVAVPMTVGGPVAARPDPLIEAAPRSQRVVMFTDSVGLGAEHALPRAFPPDWDVRVIGKPAQFVERLESDFVRPNLAANPDWFGDHVVIAAGYNYPYWDPERFDRSIDSMVNTLTAAGVQHVHWVTLREVKPQYISASAWRQVQPYYWYFPTVNDHLEDALERHPNLRLVDWAAVADQPGLTYDAIHLNNTGAALYSQIIRLGVDAAATSVPDESTTRITVPGAAGRSAAFVNITTTDPRTRGHLRLWDCSGPPPLVSMHSYQRGQTVAHSGVAQLGAAGEFCVFAKASANLVVDVSGTFTGDGAFTPLAPVRWNDSRTPGGGGRVAPGATVPLYVGDLPTGAGAGDDPAGVVVVATALESSEQGWLRVVGCDQAASAEIASVNHPPQAATPNLVVARPAPDGSICVTSRTSSHVVVDVFGVFDDPAAVALGDPVRWFDSRDGGERLPAGSVTVVELGDRAADSLPGGVIVNVTSVDALAPGFVTVYPCGGDRPLAANLNTAGGVVSNAAIVAPSADGTVCVYNKSEMHLVVDLMGTIDASFAGRTPQRVLDTRT